MSEISSSLSDSSVPLMNGHQRLALGCAVSARGCFCPTIYDNTESGREIVVISVHVCPNSSVSGVRN